jgi:hypothetical protein
MKRAMGGFTIMEVLMFLAISGVMFTIAFAGTRGQVDSVAFRQSVNDIELKMREIFNNVDNGYFNSSGQFQGNCTLADTSSWINTTSGGGGNSTGCVFRGKVMSFDSSASNSNKLAISTLIANMTYSTQIMPPLLNESYTYQYSLVFKKAFTVNSTGTLVALSGNVVNVGSVLNPTDAAGNSINSDLRASRFATNNTWPSVYSASDLVVDTGSSTRKVLLCFSLGNKNASILVTQKDLIVDYNGVGC